MYKDLLRSVLIVVVGFLLQLGLKAIGVEIDPALFNTLVTAIVATLLGLFATEATIQGVRTFVAYRARIKAARSR